MQRVCKLDAALVLGEGRQHEIILPFLDAVDDMGIPLCCAGRDSRSASTGVSGESYFKAGRDVRTYYSHDRGKCQPMAARSAGEIPGRNLTAH
jgi:hypothetical protein